MDLSDLESRVRALETFLDSLEWLVTISTLLVVIGLVIEYWEPLEELILAVKKRPPFPWRKLAGMLGGVLVTVGVAGELWFQSRVSTVETSLRSTSHRIEDLLNNEAGGANERANVALTDNLRLEAQIHPRELTESQLRDITERTAIYSGRPISVRSYVMDIESKRFGLLLESALGHAGLLVSDNLGTVFNRRGQLVEGIEIRGPEHTQDDLINALLASPLGQEFRMSRNPLAGITGNFGDEAIGENPGIYSGTRVEIFVGIKPLGAQ